MTTGQTARWPAATPTAGRSTRRGLRRGPRARTVDARLEARRQPRRVRRGRAGDVPSDRPTARTAAATRRRRPEGVRRPTTRSRWVPIGPSVVRRGQASGRPRVTGRIRDLAVDATAAGRTPRARRAGSGTPTTAAPPGRRSAAGPSAPVGPAARQRPGRAAACSSTSAADDPAHDFVLVGTGEPVAVSPRPRDEGCFGGLGVLAARGARPTSAGRRRPVGAARPGSRRFEGLGIFRLARRPGRVAGGTDGRRRRDQVLAATSGGLFLGTRTPASPARCRHASTRWAELTTASTRLPAAAGPRPAVTDVLWLPGGAMRIVVAVDAASGVAVQRRRRRHVHVAQRVLAAGRAPAVRCRGSASLARVPGTNTLYVLTGAPADRRGAHRRRPTTPARSSRSPTSPSRRPPAVRRPASRRGLWGTQRDYDQAHRRRRGRRHRTGSTSAASVVQAVPRTSCGGSLWCFDVGAGARARRRRRALAHRRARHRRPGRRRRWRRRRRRPGLIGNNVHADVHACVWLAGAGAPTRQVWVGCDGGVFVSHAGRPVNTFASAVHRAGRRSQPTSCASHPTLEPLRGRRLPGQRHARSAPATRCGRRSLVGDGGGIVVPPGAVRTTSSRQYITRRWSARPTRASSTRPRGSPAAAPTRDDRENGAGVSAFYSGAAAVAPAPRHDARIAVGTNRVWITDDLGAPAPTRGGVLPFPRAGHAGARPARQRRTDRAAERSACPTPGRRRRRRRGVGPLGRVVDAQVGVARPQLLVLFQRGVVRWVETPPALAARRCCWSGDQPATVAARQPRSSPTSRRCRAPGLLPDHDRRRRTNTAVDTCYLFDRRRRLQPRPACARARPAGSPPVTTGRSTRRTPSSWTRPTPPAGVRRHRHRRLARRRTAAPTGDACGRRSSTGCRRPPCRTWRSGPTRRAPGAAAAAGRGPGARGVGGRPGRATSRRGPTCGCTPATTGAGFPTPLANPRRAPPARAAEHVFESPDIVVRPARRRRHRAARGMLGAAGRSRSGNAPAYQLWTFQTAFRWLFPSVLADGQWTDAFGDLVRAAPGHLRLRRAAPPPAGSSTRRCGTPSSAAPASTRRPAAVRRTPAHPLAVYRAARGTPPARRPCRPPRSTCSSACSRARCSAACGRCTASRSTVDVLLHHRDTRPVAGERRVRDPAVAVAAPTRPTLLGAPVARLWPRSRQDLPHGHRPADAGRLDAGRTGARRRRVHRLPVAAGRPDAPGGVDRRRPDDRRSRPQHFVLFLAIAGSTATGCARDPGCPPRRQRRRCGPGRRLAVRRAPAGAGHPTGRLAPRPGPSTASISSTTKRASTAWSPVTRTRRPAYARSSGSASRAAASPAPQHDRLGAVVASSSSTHRAHLRLRADADRADVDAVPDQLVGHLRQTALVVPVAVDLAGDHEALAAVRARTGSTW